MINNQPAGKAGNKVSKYLLYAIGEIVLVMIGILLAVQIDDWNEKRKLDLKIESYLIKVLDDLAIDIQSANEVLRYYDVKDSVIMIALKDTLTVQDYRNDHSKSLRYLTTGAKHIKIHDNGFIKLMDNSENIHPKYQSILDILNEMYVYQKYEVDKFDERLNLMTDQNYDHMIRTIPGAHTIWQYKMDDRLIDYFVNDPLYKNEIQSYRNYAIFNYTGWIVSFTSNALDAYRMIRSQLDDKTDLADFIPQNSITPSPETITHFTGTFEVIANNNNGPLGRKFVMEAFQDHMIFYAEFNPEIKSEWFFRSARQLYNGINGTMTLDFKSTLGEIVINYQSTEIDGMLLKIK